MRYRDFKSAVLRKSNEYFRRLADGKFPGEWLQQAIFPQFIIFSETRDHYCFELAGLASAPGKLAPRERKANSVEELFDPLLASQSNEEVDAVLGLNGSSGFGFSGVAVSRAPSVDALRQRFPIVSTYDLRFSHLPAARLIGLNDRSHNLSFENCLMISGNNEVFRCKYVQYAKIFSKRILESESSAISNLFWNNEDRLYLFQHGVIFAGGQRRDLLAASELQSLFLSEGIHETTIGSFIDSNPEFLRRFFNSRSHVYEPTLPWLQHDGSVRDTAINPDLLIERQDGYFDIVDLKLAGLNKKKLTKGDRRRRRFIDYVNDGIAQLSNYRFYFNFPENRQEALRRCGVRVDDPALHLIIGHSENYIASEVAEALRSYSNENLSIIDYDALALSVIRTELSEPSDQQEQE